MTVIAGFHFNGAPVLFSDLLVTGPISTDKKLSIPTEERADTIFGEGVGWGIQKLQQKMVGLTPGVSIAWSGSLLGAQIGTRALLEMRNAGTLSYATMENYLLNDPDMKAHPTTIVGAQVRSSNVDFFSIPSSAYKTRDVGLMHIAGSGTNSVLQFIDDNWLRTMTKVGRGSHSDAAISVGLALSASYLNKEALEKGESTLLNGFGGGYEVLTLDKGQLSRVGDRTYILWIGVFKDNALSMAPHTIIKSTYIDHNLILKSTQVKLVEDIVGQAIFHNAQYSIAKPLYPKPSPTLEQLEAIPMTSPCLCHCFQIESYGMIGTFSRIQVDNPVAPSMTFSSENNEWSYWFEPNFVKNIHDNIVSRIKSSLSRPSDLASPTTSHRRKNRAQRRVKNQSPKTN